MSATFALLAAEETTTSSGGGLLGLLPLVLIFAVMYFLLLRPQRKRQKETTALQSAIAVGDEIVLNSGNIGFVSGIEDDWLWLDVAPVPGSGKGIEIRVAKGNVARKLGPKSE